MRTRTRKSRKNINFPLSALSHRLITLDHKLIMKLSDRRASNKRYYLSLGIIAAPTRSQYAHNSSRREMMFKQILSSHHAQAADAAKEGWSEKIISRMIVWDERKLIFAINFVLAIILTEDSFRCSLIMFKCAAYEKKLRSNRQRCCVSDSIKVPKFKS